ncbi:MAG: sugar-binding protein [Armatimonadota bacterium]
MRITITVTILAMMVSLGGTHAHAEPRAAAVYSSFHNEQYRNEQTPTFAELGWQQDQFENTKIAELAGKLSQYDLIVFTATYNYENPQDFTRYAPEFKQYIENGGCIVVTDANYPQQYGWLDSIHPGLRWIGSGESNPWGDSPAKWTAVDHPLMQGVRPPGAPWTRPRSWSQVLTPLVVDAGGRPVISYLEIGKGIAIVSSAYQQYGWPSARFYTNMLAWAKDAPRINSATERWKTLESMSQKRPEIDIPVLSKAPAIDGKIDTREWQGAALINDFTGINGDPMKTVCHVAQSGDSLYVAFECSATDVSGLIKKHMRRDDPSWLDDCVEVFLNPDGDGSSSLHFAVNALGTQFDARDGDPSWDRYWTAKTSITTGTWRAEIRIPFSSLGSKKLPSTWTANFDRRTVKSDGLGQIISGWAPSSSGFSVPSSFGLLKGIKDNAVRTVASELTAAGPDRWMVGLNKVTVATGSPVTKDTLVIITCIDADTGRKLASSGTITTAAGKPLTASLSVPIESDGEHSLQFIDFDAGNLDRSLSSSKILRVAAEPSLTLKMLSPSFRGSIQSRDPQKKLLLEGSIADIKSAKLRINTSITGSSKSTPHWQRVMDVKSGGSFRVESSLADLPIDDYILRVDLIGDNDRLLGWKQMPLRVLPPAPMEVTFDEKKICYVDGEPFFPIGLYHIAPVVLDRLNTRNREIGLPDITLDEALTSAKNAGFNCVHHTWGMAGEEYLSIAQRLGLYVMPEIGAPDEESLKKMVSLADKYRNVLLWYGLDEPSGERLKTAIEAHDMFARLDPHRPVSAACCNPAVFPGASQAYDILTMDPYFIRFAPLTNISDWIEKGKKDSNGIKPIWVVPQAFTVGRSAWSEPTNEELRCQAYLSLVHGATGLVWYAYWSSEPYEENPKGRNQWFLPDSHLWEYFPKLNAEVQKLSPVFLKGTSQGSSECSSKDIRSNIWTHNGARYLIAVNPTDKPVNCSFTKLKGTKAEVMFENRGLDIKTGMLEDQFKPLEAHVYRLK